MFEFFKRWTSPAPAVQRSPSKPKSKPRRSRDTSPAPPPLPEVVEGNDESDWALWEDSKTVLDSQMQGLARASGHGKLQSSQFDTIPSELGNVDSLYGDPDPFGTVRKRDR